MTINETFIVRMFDRVAEGAFDGLLGGHSCFGGTNLNVFEIHQVILKLG